MSCNILNPQVNGPSMFPTFNGRGWNVVVAEALPGVHDRVKVGELDTVSMTRGNQQAFLHAWGHSGASLSLLPVVPRAFT